MENGERFVCVREMEMLCYVLCLCYVLKKTSLKCHQSSQELTTTRQKQIWDHRMMQQKGWWKKRKKTVIKNIDLEVYNISYVVM